MNVVMDLKMPNDCSSIHWLVFIRTICIGPSCHTVVIKEITVYWLKPDSWELTIYILINYRKKKKSYKKNIKVSEINEDIKLSAKHT